MGRSKRNQYFKDLHQLAYDRLTGMLAFGESKKEAVMNGTEKDKIFSHATYETYWKHIKYFIKWLKTEHPNVTTLKAAKRFVNEWLEIRVDQVDDRGNHLSAWTVQTEAAALNKLFQIDKADPDRFQPPKRNRAEIRRSRVMTERDKHFSTTNNAELIAFCQGTGCRRNVLQRLEGRDLWSKEQMQEEVKTLESKETLTEKEQKHLNALKDALSTFPESRYDYFLHHRKDKGGRYRFAPIIGPHKEQIVKRMQDTGARDRVWQYVNSNADVHSYRADYATRMYKDHARKIEDIPYDKVHKGLGKRYQGDVYTCRKDESGKKLDRAAMLKCSKALGHNRISVVADNYIRAL